MLLQKIRLIQRCARSLHSTLKAAIALGDAVGVAVVAKGGATRADGEFPAGMRGQVVSADYTLRAVSWAWLGADGTMSIKEMVRALTATV